MLDVLGCAAVAHTRPVREGGLRVVVAATWVAGAIRTTPPRDLPADRRAAI